MSLGGFVVLFVLGACFGSFGGVLLNRLQDFSVHGLRDVVFGRSQCDHTGNKLRWFELIPIVSYLLQRGKSRHSGQQLSQDYLRLELTSGCVFVATVVLTHTDQLQILIYQIIVNWLLLLLAWYDSKHQFLHTPLWAILVIRQICLGVQIVDQTLLSTILFGAIFGVIRLLARWYARTYYQQHEGFGSGDVLLSLIIGSTVPYIFTVYGIPFSLQTLLGILIGYLCISSILGLLYALIVYIVSGKKVVYIPFLPAMIVAYWILLYRGDMLLRFVLTL